MTNYQNTLNQLHQNLAILREREAKYGGNAPLDLLNQISDHREAITLTEQAITEEITETEWREALEPLLVNIQERQSEAASVTIGDIGGDIINSIIAGRDVHLTEIHHHYPAEKPSPRPSTLNTAPPPPEKFIPRPAEFNQLLEPLLNPAANRTLALTTALQGGGGFGKTTLAQALCHQESVQRAYPLILWLDLGETPSLIELLNNQIRLLDTQATSFTDINAAAARLRDLLTDQTALMVLDDVWQESHATPFIQRSPTCVHLITTRRQDVANWLNAQAVNVSEMATAEAADLLTSRLDERPTEMEPFRRLAAHLGEWPLLLTLAAAQLRELVHLDHLPLDEALAELWAALKEEGLTAFDRADEQQRNRAISRSLALSLERLGEWRERYLELVVFPEDVDIPFAALERLWAGLTSRQVKTAVRAMHHLSLFSRYDAPGQTVRLHDVIRRYLIEQQQDLPGLQRRFLNAYRPPSSSPQRGEDTTSPLLGGTEGGPPPPWADLPTDEPYLWDYLVYHLSEAGLADELYSTLTHLRYLAAKSYARSGAAAEADLRAAQKEFPDDALLRTLSRHFANAAYLLGKGETLQDVRLILYSRLHSIEGIGPLCQSLVKGLRPPYLLPNHPLPDLPHPLLIRTLFIGYTGFITDCAYSPDGRTILSTSTGNTLKLWDVQTGQVRLTLTGHTDRVNGYTYSPDGQTILSASEDKTLKLWNAQTGQERLTLAGHRDRVNGFAYSPDGRTILSASKDKTLKVWDAQTGQVRLTLTGHTSVVTSCAYSPDGRTILSASSDNTLKVWDAQTGQERLTLTGHTASVRSCTYSPDGRTILSASRDKTLKLWDAQTGQERLTLTGHTAPIKGCTFSLDGQTILSASDYMLKLWDVRTGQERLTLVGHKNNITHFAYSPDSRTILSSSIDRTLKVWDAQTGQVRLTLTNHMSTVWDCTYSPDGRAILSASGDYTLKLWDISSLFDLNSQTEQERLTLTGHTAEVNGCAYSPDGRFILSASADKTLKVWDAQTGQVRLTLTGHTSSIRDCTYSPDGWTLLSASTDQTLKLWDVRTGQERLTLATHRFWVDGCTYSPDGRFILSASTDQTLKLWDAQTGQERLTLTASPNNAVNNYVYSSDGRMFKFTPTNDPLKVEDTLTGHMAPVRDCAYSPDGRTILSASDDNTLKLWDAQTGLVRLTLTGHTAPVSVCAYSPDGRFILSASGDKMLKIWDAQTGQERLTLTGHTSTVTGCTYSPDGQTILSAAYDNILKVWDAQTGHCLATLAVEGALKDCAWSPDGTSVVAVGNGGVYFFKVVL